MYFLLNFCIFYFDKGQTVIKCKFCTGFQTNIDYGSLRRVQSHCRSGEARETYDKSEPSRDLDSVKIKAPAPGHVQLKKQGHHTIDTILNKSVLDHSLNPLQRFKDPRLASSCTGYLASNVIEEKMLINMKTNPSSSFYADQKTFEIKDAAGNTIIEKKLISARSRNCCFSSPYVDEVGKEYPFPSFICISCQGISKSRSFENEMNKRDALGDPIIKPTTNIKFLDREALENKSRDQAALIKYLRLHLHECKRRALEAALRRNEDPIYSFLKDANNGNIDKLVVNIINAAKAGKLEENSFKYKSLVLT